MNKKNLLKLLYVVKDLSDKNNAVLCTVPALSNQVIRLLGIAQCYKGALGIISVALGVMTVEQFQNYVSGQEWRK